MQNLVFIDDDLTELDAFKSLIGNEYEIRSIHWPQQAGLLHDSPPDIFVSDLYLPPRSGDINPTDSQFESGKNAANKVATHFSLLYSETTDNKARLQETMKAISEAYEMLQIQWEALGQSPENGFALLSLLKARYPHVPFVFYSRKVTPEDVITALQRGADDVIRKGALTNEELLSRLANAATKHNIVQNEVSEVNKAPRTGLHVTRGLISGLKTWGEGANTWVEVGAKIFGLVTAVFTFLLAKDKLFDWLHETHTVSSTATVGLDSLAIIVAWYLVIWLLLVTGGVLESIFEQLWKMAYRAIARPKRANQTTTPTKLSSLEQTVPKWFRLSWDVCVLVLAIVPALKYTLRIIQH